MAETTLPIFLITSKARAWIERGRPARLLQRHKRSFTLTDDHGALFSLVSDAALLGPFSALVTAQPGTFDFQEQLDPEVQPGVQASRLRLGAWVFESSEARAWEPKPAWDRLRDLTGWQARLLALRETLASAAPPGSLMLFSFDDHDVVDVTQPPFAGEAFHTRMLQQARPAVLRLQQGLQNADWTACREAALALAGLGRGTTPAGDDFLIGVMHALWAGLPESEAKWISHRLAQVSAPRTNQLSAAWLRAAADGEATWPWHRLIATLSNTTPRNPSARLADRDQEFAAKTPLSAALDLLAIGHTSGADALAGFLRTLQTFSSDLPADQQTAR
jgi:hypothetical protein